MAGGKVEHVALRGIACAVPANIVTLEDEAATFGEDRMEKWFKQFGVRQRHVAPPGMCTSDLCFAAAEKLLGELGWERDSVELVLFVSITRDYVSPPTSGILQHRLGLSTSCAAMDITLPCAGYPYGLWTAATMLSSGNLKRALLMVGDTHTRMVAPRDPSHPLAGDGASVSAVEWDPDAEPMFFEAGADGSGARHLLKKAGGFRHPSTEKTRERSEAADGAFRCDEDLLMNGAEIFAFSLREVPLLMDKVLEHAGWAMDDVDHVIMHQANLFMMRTVARKLKVPKEKQVECVERFGNTGGASMSFAVVEELGEKLRHGPARLVLLGFGAGLSWGGAAITCGPMVLPELTLVRAEDVVLGPGL